METRLNIAEILKDKPVNTRLYSPIFGNCILVFPEGMIIKDKSGKIRYFYDDGRFSMTGESLLFPSKEMRDWSKFAWKKGDVLMAGVDNFCIFDKWNNDEYTEFDAAFVNPDYRSDVLKTKYWHKVISETIIKRHIFNIERNYGGKLNLTTLEIEKAQPEFKDGDIALADYGNRQYIFIVSNKTDLSEGYNSLISLDLWDSTLNMGGYRMSFFKENLSKLRLATDSEKQQLFDALAKKGKAWDAEKKQIVDLKPKVKFKPFDKVVAYCEILEGWSCDIFSHYAKNYEGKEVIVCLGGGTYYKALPFNEETAKLLGTTKNVED